MECDGHRYIIHGTSRKHWRRFVQWAEYIDIPSINTTMYRGTHGRERPTHSELHVLVVTLTKGKEKINKNKKTIAEKYWTKSFSLHPGKSGNHRAPSPRDPIAPPRNVVLLGKWKNNKRDFWAASFEYISQTGRTRETLSGRRFFPSPLL